jgi:ketosteroid isomerase-like protein
MLRYTIALSLMCCLAAGCRAPDPAPSIGMRTDADISADRAAIQKLSATYQAAFKAGDSKQISLLYAEDALIHPANESPVRGRANLDAYFAASNGEPIDETLDTVEIILSEGGDMAYEVGRTMNSAGAGKYLTIFRKIDGRWLIAADTWSHDTPPSASP